MKDTALQPFVVFSLGMFGIRTVIFASTILNSHVDKHMWSIASGCRCMALDTIVMAYGGVTYMTSLYGVV